MKFKPYTFLNALICACLLMSVGMTISACETKQHTQARPLPVMTFDHHRPMLINVGMLKTEQKMASHNKETFVVSPYQTLERYLHSRFQPIGRKGALVATIEDASMEHTYEASHLSAAQLLKVDGLDVYDMQILLKLEHVDDSGSVQYGTVLTVRRIIKVSEHASIATRERAQFNGMEALFRDLDREVLRIVLSDMDINAGQD